MNMKELTMNDLINKIKMMFNKNPLANAIAYMVLSLVLLLLAENASQFMYTLALIGAIVLQLLAMVHISAYFRIRKLQNGSKKTVKKRDRKQ